MAQYTPVPKLQILFEKGLYTECIDKSNIYLEKNREELYPYFWQLRSYLEIHKSKFHEKKKTAYDKALTIATKLKKKDSRSYFSKEYPEVFDEIMSEGKLKAKSGCGENQEKAVNLLNKLSILERDPELEFALYECFRSHNDPSAVNILTSLVESLPARLNEGIIEKDTFESYYAALASELVNLGKYYKAVTICRKARFSYRTTPKCEAAMALFSNKLIKSFDFNTDLNTLKSANRYILSLDSVYGGIANNEIKLNLSYLMASRYLQLATEDKPAEALTQIKAYISQIKEPATDSIQNFFISFIFRNEGKPNYYENRVFSVQTEITRFFMRFSLFEAAKFVNSDFQKRKLWKISYAYLKYCQTAFPKDKTEVNRLKSELDKKVAHLIKSGEFSPDFNDPDFRPSGTELKRIQLEKDIQDLTRLLNAAKYREFAVLMSRSLLLYPEEKRLLELKKQFVIADYRQMLKNEQKLNTIKLLQTPASELKCNPGAPSAEAVSMVLARLNYVRRLAGIPDSSVFDPVLNRQCQAAALMMDANNSLNHSPPKNWKCYSNEGATAAGSGNLSLGHGFTEALMGQVEDAGSGNFACGHRRWILNPYNRVFGFGSTENAMCLKVFGNAVKKVNSDFVYRDSQFIAWPSADYFPLALAPERWSFSLPDADFSKAVVKVFLNGKPVKVTVEKLAEGYALNTIVWIISELPLTESVYTIQISNVKNRSGKVLNFTYKTTLLKIE